MFASSSYGVHNKQVYVNCRSALTLATDISLATDFDAWSDGTYAYLRGFLTNAAGSWTSGATFITITGSVDGSAGTNVANYLTPALDLNSGPLGVAQYFPAIYGLADPAAPETAPIIGFLKLAVSGTYPAVTTTISLYESGTAYAATSIYINVMYKVRPAAYNVPRLPAA